MAWATDKRKFARIMKGTTSVARTARGFSGQAPTTKRRITAEIPGTRSCVGRIGIMSGAKRRLFVLFETRSSGRLAARMGTEAGGNGTVSAEV